MESVRDGGTSMLVEIDHENGAVANVGMRDEVKHLKNSSTKSRVS